MIVDNVKITSNGTKITIEFDTSAKAQKAAKPSSTGKSRLLATTKGMVAVEGCPIEGLKLALNVTIPV